MDGGVRGHERCAVSTTCTGATANYPSQCAQARLGKAMAQFPPVANLDRRSYSSSLTGQDVMRHDRRWTAIFDAIPSVIPAGFDQTQLTPGQRQFIADAVYRATKPPAVEQVRMEPGTAGAIRPAREVSDGEPHTA